MSEDFVLLSLHPFYVHDLLSLKLEVISALPIGLTLLILALVERIELLIAGLYLLLYLIGLSQGLIFLDISLLHFLPDSLDFFV